MPDTLPLNPLTDNQKLLAQVIDYYCRTLKETTEGLDYLRSRGVTVGEAIDHFRIGYANRTLGLTLPTMDSKAGREIRARLQQVGLFRSSGHEHMNGCIVFPITAADGSGQVVDIYGRKIGARSSQGNAIAHAPVGPAAGRVEHRSVPGRQRDHSLRRPLGCLDVLECRLPQRDLHLWR